MALDDGGDRTEAPTPRRLQEARDEGRIPRSVDLTAAVALMAAVILLKILGDGLFGGLLQITGDLGEPLDVAGGDLAAVVLRVALATARGLLPFLGLLLLATALGAVVQSGLSPSLKPLEPKLEKLNPAAGVRRLFSLDSATRAGQGVFKITLVALVAYVTITGELDTVLNAGLLEPAGIVQMSAALLYKLALRLGLTLLVLALLDYWYQRWNWWRRLKMTKQEVRDELKRMEGDPQMRHRRRQLQMRLALQRVGIDVPKADVVVTNPTEYAVALKYDEATMTAPRVMAKGKDLLAARIRQVAQQHRIPIVQRPPLARALYAAVEVGKEVPPAYYRAVAEVLAYVYRITGKLRAAG
ncbi:MAG TPA: flagellar biosynthesis protein FlhB [Phycisphaerae bacterium]|nr:flagellar biosynthesis protein FlhB [Phycisphaerae bacterium]